MGLPAADEGGGQRNWPPQLQAAAAAGWSSFLAACLGSLLCFAVLDPQLVIDGLHLGPDTPPAAWLTPTGLYTLGFFLFWLVGAVAAWLTVVLTRDTRP